MDIKGEIRSVLIEMFNEAAPSIHFKDRIFNRLTSILNTRPSFDYSNIENEISILKKTNFNPNESFAIQLKIFSTTFVSKGLKLNSPSVGNEIWAVVRNNIIETIFFRNSSQKNTEIINIDNTISFKSILNNYKSSEKKSDGTVDFNYSKNNKRKRKGKIKKTELNLPYLYIKGVKWYVDEENEELIYAKNIKNKISFNDLQEDILEKVIDVAISNSMV